MEKNILKSTGLIPLSLPDLEQNETDSGLDAPEPLKEIWEWKEKVRLEEESWGDICPQEKIKRVHESVSAFMDQMGLNLEIVHCSSKEKAK